MWQGVIPKCLHQVTLLSSTTNSSLQWHATKNTSSNLWRQCFTKIRHWNKHQQLWRNLIQPYVTQKHISTLYYFHVCCALELHHGVNKKQYDGMKMVPVYFTWKEVVGELSYLSVFTHGHFKQYPLHFLPTTSKYILYFSY
jgi:hypothetical protein